MTCHKHHICKEKAMQTASELCAQHGHRFTESRKRVFEAIISSHKALTAKDLMVMIGNKQAPITYRALDFFTQVGLVHHIGALNSYVACTHNHDDDKTYQLLICKDCYEVQEIHSQKAVSKYMEATKKENFTPLETHVEIIGLCSKCQH